MHARIRIFALLLAALPLFSSRVLAADAPGAGEATVSITVDPFTTRSIEGESRLDRKRYFALCDSGWRFESRVGSAERYDYLVKELGVSFGRNLGPIRAVSRNGNFAREDRARPGHADLAFLERQLGRLEPPSADRLRRDFGSNLDVVAHGASRAYPEFMEIWRTPELEKQEGESEGHGKAGIPAHPGAAAEFAAAVLKGYYDDLTRPRFFEPINEPHWSFLTQPENIARWHLETRKKVHAATPGVLVGGPCMSVGYLYNRNYQSFNSLRRFIDATGGELDFYSFHVYDYHRWQDEKFGGTILSGLPLEGVLDLVPNYTSLKHGRVKPLVVSEHGGYINAGTGDHNRAFLEELARPRIPGSGFAWQMKARSIQEYLQVNSIIANTLAFMEHPHTVRKAVPFLLLESSGWDPHYYATLYARRNFDPKNPEWVPGTLHYFYRLFQGVEGRRVLARSDDPDIQFRSFVAGERLILVAHNLSERAEILSIEAPAPASAVARRYGRRDDLTPFLRLETVDFKAIPLGPRETLTIIARYPEALPEKKRLEESVHYGDAVVVAADQGATVTVAVPEPATVEYATLRVGFYRPAEAGKEMTLLVNGTPVPSVIEDSAHRFTHEWHGYGSTRIVSLDPKLLQERNEVAVSFPDGGPATIGSVVIRAARGRAEDGKGK